MKERQFQGSNCAKLSELQTMGGNKLAAKSLLAHSSDAASALLRVQSGFQERRTYILSLRKAVRRESSCCLPMYITYVAQKCPRVILHSNIFQFLSLPTVVQALCPWSCVVQQGGSRGTVQMRVRNTTLRYQEQQERTGNVLQKQRQLSL